MQTTQPLQDFVIETIAAVCKLERSAVTMNTSLLDIGADSVSLVAIATQVQMYYGVHLTPDELMDLFDAPRVEDLIASLRQMIDRRISG